MSVPKLESANIVLIGNFNPYLISPEWLKTQKIWAADEIHLALGALKQDGVQFHSEGTEWYVSSNRLMIASSELDCGELAAKVLAELPHTPMSAVGSNFVFQDDSQITEHPIFGTVRAGIPEQLHPELLRWGAVAHEDDVRIEVMFVSGDQGQTVSFNHHRTMGSTEEARQAASMFGEDKEKSNSLLKQFLHRKGK